MMEIIICFLAGYGVALLVHFVISCISSLVRYVINRRNPRHRTGGMLQRSRGGYHLRDVPSGSNHAAPPPLPRSVEVFTRSTMSSVLPAGQGIVRKTPDMFPRCPIHRCCNRPGEEQKIFWDAVRGEWRCYRGHYFAS